MVKVIHVEAKPDFVLALTFDDGLKEKISITDRLFMVLIVILITRKENKIGKILERYSRN